MDIPEIMKKIKKAIRTSLFFLFIILAAIVPFPIPVFSRDRAPKYIMEQVDNDKEDEDEENEKV